MSVASQAKTVVTVAAVLVRASAYIVRAHRTKTAVERMKSRYEDRAASARYLSEAMTVLNTDEPTTAAYMEVSRLGTAAAGNVGTIIAATDALVVNAQGMEAATQAEHGRMQDANRTHSVQMSDSPFIERR